MTSTRTVEELLASYPSDVQALAIAAGGLIRRLLPNVEEGVDSSASVIGCGFGPGYRGLICTLILNKSGVKLGLVRGAELDDRRGLLRGEGKVHRHVQLHELVDLRRPGLSALIEAAMQPGWDGTKRLAQRRRPDEMSIDPRAERVSHAFRCVTARNRRLVQPTAHRYRYGS